jgi:FkbM family methyltransferase
VEAIILMGKLTSWLTKEEPIRPVPVFDKAVVFLHKISYLVFYLILRCLLRIVLGRKRRNKMYSKIGMHFHYQYDLIPSLSIIKFFYPALKYFRLDKTNPFLLKINISKYGFRAYCPISKDDLINMTIREDEIIDHFRPKERDIIVDIGAHIGRYTIISSKRTGPHGKVIAIEADPANFELLKRNINLNKLANVTSLNYAVYSRQTKLKLYLPGRESGCTIRNTIMLDRGKHQKKFIEVYGKTLDNILMQNEIDLADINWIKIDVEGAEFEVLKGAQDVLFKSNDIAILIEIHNSQNGTNLYRHIIEFLNNYNFKIVYEKIHDGGERHIIVRKQP